MVRVVCPNFQRPRSRHSSGESPYSIDTDLARRAAEALTTLNSPESRQFDSDTETSSDLCWESDGGAYGDQGSSDSSPEPTNNGDVLKKRRARRRERNKLSAQAYRQRRKEQTLSQQKVLSQLEEQKKGLLQQIRELETEKNQVESFLRSCFVRQDTTKTTPFPIHDSQLSLCHQFNNNENNNNNNNNNIVNNNCAQDTAHQQATDIPEMMLVS